MSWAAAGAAIYRSAVQAQAAIVLTVIVLMSITTSWLNERKLKFIPQAQYYTVFFIKYMGKSVAAFFR